MLHMAAIPKNFINSHKFMTIQQFYDPGEACIVCKLEFFKRFNIVIFFKIWKNSDIFDIFYKTSQPGTF